MPCSMMGIMEASPKLPILDSNQDLRLQRPLRCRYANGQKNGWFRARRTVQSFRGRESNPVVPRREMPRVRTVQTVDGYLYFIV